MASTYGNRSCDVVAPQVPSYFSDKYREYEVKLAEKFAARGKIPYCGVAPKRKTVTMVSKNGTEFTINTDYTYLEDNVDPRSMFIWSKVLTDDSEAREFSYGNMEAARKILWKSLQPCLKRYKTGKQRWQNLITPACFSFLSDVQSRINGELDRCRALFSRKYDEEFIPEVQPQTPTMVEYAVETSGIQVSNEQVPQQAIVETIEECGVVEELDDNRAEERIADLVEEWPSRYYERFQRWFCRRMDKFTQQRRRFDYYCTVYADECLHHVINWHNTLKKALMKDRLIDKSRLKVRSMKIKNDAPGFTKIASINPKTRVLEYVPKRAMEEQADDGQNANNLESASEVSTSSNITFVDERPVDHTSLHTKSETFSRDLHNDIAENDWNINKVLEREYPIKSFEWKVTDKITTKLIDAGLPKMITDDKNCMITRQLMFFSFLRAGLKVRVQLNGTKFHCGRLIVYFKPITWDDDKEENFYSLTCFPHFFLDASVSNSGEILIPFTHLLSYFSQESKTLFSDSTNTLGTLNIRPYNPLQAAEKSSQSLFGQVFVSLTDPYVHLPTYQIQAFSYGDGYMQSLESVLKKAAGSAINSGLGLADKFTGGLVTGTGNAICNLLGICDKPSDPVSAQPMINRTVASVCQGAGLDRSVRLGLSPVSQTNTSPGVLGAVDSDFNLLTLCKMPCLLDQPEWNVTHTPGTKLFDMLVTPTYISKAQFSSNGESRYANYSPTMLAYISRAFCYWRGTLMVKIQIVATQFHSGRLALVYDPHGTHDVNIVDFDKNKSHNIIIMDVQEKQEMTIELPYFAIKPWLRCDRFRSSVNLVDGEGIINPSNLDCDIAGVFRIYVLNSLVRPDNVSDKIQINVMFYAGDNFELSVINPVSPLSVRSGPTGVQYPNFPRYAWCTKGSTANCPFNEQIMNLYYVGRRLFDNGYIGKGDKWYAPVIKIKNPDTISFAYSGDKLAYYMESATGPCADLINALPNYDVPSLGPILERIDGNVSATKGDVVDVAKDVRDTKTDVSFIRSYAATNYNRLQKMEKTLDNTAEVIDKNEKDIEYVKQFLDAKGARFDNTYYNTISTLNDTKDLKITATQINNSTDRIYSACQLIDDHVTANSSALGGVLKTDVCYKQKIVGGPVQQIAWKKEHDGVCEPMVEQGAESYTTTRENDGAQITITEGNNQSTVAPGTVSENAMNLQTILRRYFPFYISGDIYHSNDFTLITIPVTPSFVPNDQDDTIVSGINRRYEVHNLAWFSRLYTYFRGSLRYKVIVNCDDADIYVWHNPVDVKDFRVTSGFEQDHLTEQLNFATDLAVTRVQQGLEVEVPFYSSFNQLVQSHVSSRNDLRAQNGTLYVAVRNRNKAFNVSLFMSTGDDFNLNVLRAPPVLHEPWIYPSTDGSADDLIKYPELQRSLRHDSSNVQIPGTFVLNRFKGGYFNYCKMPEAPDFRLNKLDKKSQPMMEEQMFKSVTGISDLEEKYEQEIKPVVCDAHDLIRQGKTFLKDFTDLTLPQILGHAKLFHKDLNETHATIKDFLPKIDTAMEHLNAFLITTGQAADKISTCAQAVGTAYGYVSWMMRTLLISSLWMNLVQLVQKFTWTGLFNVICLLCALFQVQASKIIEWIVTNATKLYEDYRSKATNGAMQEQGFEEFLSENSETVTLVLAGVATVIYCALFGSLPSWSHIKNAVRSTVEKGKCEEQGLGDFLRSMHFANMGVKAINNAFEFFREWIDKLVQWYLGNDCKSVLLEKQFKEKAEKIEQWMLEVEKLEDEDLYQLALSDLDTHNRFYRLVDQGNEFNRWLLTEGVSKNVSTIIRDVNRRLHDMIKRIKKISPGHGFRYAPFVIMLDGPSGVAKSNMMHKFTDLIREELDIPHYNSVCVVPKTKEFLDGYEGQAIIEWDDMLQCPKQDEMVAEFINWRSNADCIINKAQIEEKGTHFTSKAIIMSTNCGDINISTIRDMNAFRNRINIRFYCHLADGITSDDLKKMPRDPEFGFARLDAYLVADSGARYDLYRKDMTLAEALDMTRTFVVAWDLKQNELIEDYFNTHGSMRIPPGVRIMEEEALVVKIDEGLTEEQRIEAELFELEFEDYPEDRKKQLYDRYQELKSKLNSNSKKYWELIKRKFTLAKNKVFDYCKEFYKKYPNFINAMGVISTLGMVGFLCKSIYDMFKEVEHEEAYSSEVKVPTKIIKAEHYSSDVKTPAKIVKAEYYNTNVKTPNKIVRAEILEEGCDDPEAVTVARNKIHPLLAVLGWEDSQRVVKLQGLAIGGKVILCPHHFFRSAKAGDFFYFLRGADKILVEFQPDRMFRIRDKDAVLYYMGPSFDSRKDIVKCFIEEKDLSRLGNSISAILMGTNDTGVMMEKAGRAKGNTSMRYSGKDEGAPVYVQNGWTYDFNTLNGECGSMLIACSKTLPPPARIVGMHVAGYSNQRGGFAILLTKEMIMEALQVLIERHGRLVYGPSLPPQVRQDEEMFNEQCKVVPQGSFSYYGVMDPKFCPSQPIKTCLRPTPFQGELYEVVKKPAMLLPKGDIKPLEEALKKYGQLTKPFPEKLVDIVKYDILNELMQIKGDMKCEPTDLETAIFGIEGMPYCEKLNFKSSPGWPYQCFPNARGQYGKAYLFDINNRKIQDKYLMEKIIERETAARRGERVPSIWRDCLKDELRPIEKVEQGKTRLFTIAPVDFTILTRKYFLAFEQAFYKNHSKFFSAVGINPESFEWTQAYNRLKEVGTKCIAGDFAGYDGKLMAQLMEACVWVINEWYRLNGETDPFASLVRRVLMDEMIHTYQLVQNCVYKTHQGNPSGNPLTVIINTMVNAFYMRLAWMIIMSRKCPRLATMAAFHEHCRDEAYGDDNRITVSDIAIVYYNQITITEVLAEHGIEYTDELKTGNIVPYKELLETSFLKRKYRFDDEIGHEIILPVMDVDTITSLTNWYRDAEDIEPQLIANQRAALDFAFFHGRKFYNDFNSKFTSKLREYGFHPISLTYDEQLNRFLNMVHGEDGHFTNFCDVGF